MAPAGAVLCASVLLLFLVGPPPTSATGLQVTKSRDRALPLGSAGTYRAGRVAEHGSEGHGSEEHGHEEHGHEEHGHEEHSPGEHGHGEHSPGEHGHEEHGHEEHGHEEHGHEESGSHDKGHGEGPHGHEEEHGHGQHSPGEHGHGEHGQEQEHGEEAHDHSEHGHDEHGHDEQGHDEHGHDEHGHDEQGHDEHGHAAASHDHDHDDHADGDEDHVGLAVGLSFTAGSALVIGGALSFPLRHFGARNRVLSTSIAFAAGVLLYLALGQMLFLGNDYIAKGIHRTQAVDDGHGHGAEEKGFVFPGDKWANLWTTLFFFGGMVLMGILEHVVHCCAPHHHAHDTPADPDAVTGIPYPEVSPKVERSSTAASNPTYASTAQTQQDVNPVRAEADAEAPNAESQERDEKDGSAEESAIDTTRLRRVVWFNAIAIVVHIIPEGFASFVTSVKEANVGVALVIGIVLHAIPAGAVVAVPAFEYTQSKLKALLWCFLVGIWHPISGVVGWAALQSVLTDFLLGVILAVDAGIMCFIVIHELFPMSRQLDPANPFITWGTMAGMAAIAATLVGLEFTPHSH